MNRAATTDSPATPRAALFAQWPLGLAFAVGLTAAAVGWQVGISRLLFEWQDIWGYAHGYLILPMAGWLFLRNVRTNPPRHVGPSLAGFVLFTGATAAYLLSQILDLTIAMQVMLPLLLGTLVAALGGLGLAARAAVPVGFLYFAIPVWEIIVWPLQSLATSVVTSVLPPTGIVANIEGSIITMAAGSIEIAEGCSGLSFLLVGLALGAFYALNWLKQWRHRLVLVAAAGAMALLVNWVRIFSLVVIGYVSDMQHYLIVEDHELFGWVLYAVMMAPVFYLLAGRLERREAAQEPPAVNRQTTPTAGAPGVLLAGVAAAVIAALPAWVGNPGTAPTEAAPLRIAGDDVAGWTAAVPDPAWMPSYKGAHLELRQSFRNASGKAVDVYAVRYLRQGPEFKLISNRNRLDDGWINEATEVRAWQGVNRAQPLVEQRLVWRGERRLVWYWFDVAGQTATSPVTAKLLELPALLRGRRDGSLIALSAACDVSCDPARARIADFLDEAYPRLVELTAIRGLNGNAR